MHADDDQTITIEIGDTNDRSIERNALLTHRDQSYLGTGKDTPPLESLAVALRFEA